MAKFQPGQSGNPKGRRKGAKNRAMTDKQLGDYLAKRTETCIDTIMDMVNDDKAAPNLKFKAANAVINFDFSMRAAEYKKKLDKMNTREIDNSSDTTEDEDDLTPILSLVAQEDS